MRDRPPLITLIVVSVALACAHGQAASTALGGDVLDRRQGQFFAAMAARDAEAVAEHFAEDAVLHVANMPPIRGRGAIRDFYGNVFGFLTASSAEPETVRVSAGGDLAYGIGSVSNRFRGREGTVEYAGKYSLVWRRIGGEWMIVLYSVSSNQPDANR